MDLKQLEAQALNYVAGLLESNKATIEKYATGPVLTVVNGAVKIADGVFSQLPFGIGALLDAALSKYVSTYESDISKYEGQGVDALAALLEKIATGL